MYPFHADFYGHEMKAIVLGYIRPELDYTSRGTQNADSQIVPISHATFSPFSSHLSCHPSDRSPFTDVHSTISRIFPTLPEDLIEDIETDKRVALNSLIRPDYQKFARDEHFGLAPVR